MQNHLVLLALVLLCCFKGYIASDAKGTFAGGNCEWREEHLTRSLRGFKIKCNNPKIQCTYSGDPHKCKFYHAKRNQVAFYQCLAKDSLKNAENACAKRTIDCSQKCGNTADFTRSQPRSVCQFIELMNNND